jgi:hypothetical protein
VGSLFAFAKVGGNTPIDSGKNSNVVSNNGSGNTTKPTESVSNPTPPDDTTTTEPTDPPTNTSKPPDGDAPDMSLPEIEISYEKYENGEATPFWPAAYIPAGFPVYPGGIITALYARPGNVDIYVSETSLTEYNKFCETLKDIGWELQWDSNYRCSAQKGFWTVYLECNDTMVTITFYYNN